MASMRMVFESAPIGIAISGPDMRFRVVNPKLAEMLGYTQDELLGKSWRELTHPDDYEASQRLVNQLEGGERAPSVIEKRYLHKSGRAIWASVTGRVIQDEITGERLTLALIQDVSAVRRTEELTRSLSEQTSRLAAIIQNSPLAVILTNEDAEITYLNRAALELLDVNEAIGLLGQSIELIDGGVDGKPTMNLTGAGRSERWLGERYFRSVPAGELIPVHVTAFPLENPQSGVGSTAIVAKDIRQRKSIERELRSSERRLRTLAQQLLRAQERERSRIARDLHDDVTQRLAMVAVELGLLQKAPESDPGLLSEKLTTIQNQVVELTETVRNLSHQYHPSVLAHSNLEGALESLCHEFGSANDLQVRFRNRADTSAVAKPTATAIYRIVQEALRNVARHSGAERVVLTLDCDDDELRIALLDDGRGFDTSTLHMGAGLGLTSMMERAGAIGGSIEIHSEPGAGTRVEITAPVSAGCEDDEDRDLD
ncbi:MAG: PAS domain S-box protein [Bryobacterales bacterium]|nr:PAS domain S-box protein [Bryobacterales bacterium]